MLEDLIKANTPETDHLQRTVKKWLNQNAKVLVEVVQDALLSHKNTPLTGAPLYTTHMVVIRVAEIPTRSHSGKLAIKDARLSPLTNLRSAFTDRAAYEPSMQHDRNMVAEWENRAGCKFYLLYLLIQCEDPDEAHLLHEIMPIPTPQTLVDRAQQTYMDVPWQKKIKDLMPDQQDFHVSDDVPFIVGDESFSEGTGLRIQRDASFIDSNCDWVIRLLVLAFLYVMVGGNL